MTEDYVFIERVVRVMTDNPLGDYQYPRTFGIAIQWSVKVFAR
jgi:hypothetical protein